MEEEPKKKRTKAIHKGGVVYLSKVPRFMSPNQCKQYFVRLGFSAARIFFTRESQRSQQARKKKRRSSKEIDIRYVEGWIEFEKKRDAKLVAEQLNGQPVGGTQVNRNDLWNLRYLSGFKFDDLKEEEVYKKKLRAQELKEGLKKAKEETEAYLERVAQAKRIEYAKSMKRKEGKEVTDRPYVVKQKVAFRNRDEAVDSDLLRNIMPEGATDGEGSKKKKKKRKDI